MKCPKCNGKTAVVCTENERRSVIRKRRCCKCRYVFYTKETESAEAHEAFKSLNKIRVAKYEAAKRKIKRKTDT
jgi:transcriptional regulator NrdR family protein